MSTSILLSGKSPCILFVFQSMAHLAYTIRTCVFNPCHPKPILYVTRICKPCHICPRLYNVRLYLTTDYQLFVFSIYVVFKSDSGYFCFQFKPFLNKSEQIISSKGHVDKLLKWSFLFVEIACRSNQSICLTFLEIWVLRLLHNKTSTAKCYTMLQGLANLIARFPCHYVYF